MGASQSSQTRTSSFQNNEPSGVIDISDDVIKRLKKGVSKEGDRSGSGDATAKQNVPSSFPNPPAKSPGVYYGEPTITSMQVRNEKEAELRANDLYWRKRLQGLEENLKKTNQIMEKEYEDAIEDVKKRFAYNKQQTNEIDTAEFQELRKNVIKCYKDNPKETLLCANEVNNFTNSVNSHRIKLIEENKSGVKSQ